jgi:hypothetical protein
MKKVFSLVLIFSCGTIAASCWCASAKEGVGEKNLQRKSRVMGTEVQIILFSRRTYNERVLPAYRSLRKGDTAPLIAVLRECVEKIESNPTLAEQLLWNKEIIEEDIGILTGTVYYSPDDRRSNQGEKKESDLVKREYARQLLASNIVQVLCVPRAETLKTELATTNNRLIPYLYEKSTWIKEVLTFQRLAKGGHLEFPIGESTEILTKEDMQRFSVELDKMPDPEDPDLRKEYINLRALLKIALDHPDWTLAVSVT